MKKIFLLAGLLGASLGFTACDEDFTDWADPQSNAQEDAAGAVSIVLANGDDATITYDASDSLLYVGKIIPAGTSGATTTSSTADVTVKTLLLNDSYSVPFTAAGDSLFVTKTALDSVVKVAYFSQAAVQRTTSIKAEGAAIDASGQAFSATSNAITVLYTPTTDIPAVESAYYLVGDMNGWNIGSPTALTANDDGTFSATVTVPDNCYFKFFGQTGITNADWDAGLGYATSGHTATSGLLSWTVDGKQPEGLLIETGGDYVFTIDPVNLTYTVALPYGEFLYLPGNAQGWTPATAPAVRSANMDGTYTGYALMNGDFKFTKARNWDAEYNFTYFTTLSSNIVQGGGTNLNIADKGYYRFDVDLVNKSVSATQVTWGVIGSATADGWNSDQDMTYNETDDCWEATLTLTAGKIKFRANDAWDINLGGSALTDLTEGGSDLDVSAGTYKIQLFTSRSASDKIYAVLTAQ